MSLPEDQDGLQQPLLRDGVSNNETPPHDGNPYSLCTPAHAASGRLTSSESLPQLGEGGAESHASPSNIQQRRSLPTTSPRHSTVGGIDYQHIMTGGASASMNRAAPSGSFYLGASFNPGRFVSPSQIFRQPSFNFRQLQTSKRSHGSSSNSVTSDSSFGEYLHMDSPAVENSGLSRKLSRLQHLQERGAATPAGPPPSKWSAQAAKFRRRLGYYVPVLGWLPKYSFAQDGLDDFVAGLTASVILIPQGITYAGLANLSPIHGLYTAFFPLLGYFVFGSGKHLSVGPEVTASILVGKSILNFPSVKALNPNSEAYDAALLSAAMALTFTVSLVGLVMGFLRMGFVDSMLSRPILAGFVQAVAAILIMDQLPFLLGLPCKDDHCSPDNTPFDLLMYTFKNIKEVNWPTVAISASSITTMLAFPSIKRRCPTFKPLQLFPEVLLVVGAATFVSWHFKLQDQGVKVLGHMEGGFSLPHVPDMRGRETIILTDAMTIMLLGFVESQIANKKCGAKHGYTVSPNRELVALGISNFFGSFFGAFCAFGSIPRTEMMMARGQKSNVASIWAAIIVGLAILFVLPLFHYTPKAVTGSIIFVVALGLVEVHELKFIVRVRKWVDLAMAFLMTLVTLVWGIDMGVFFAFGSCLLMAVKQTTLPSLTVLGRGDNDGDYRDLMDLDEHTKKIDGVLIYKVDGALFFANAQKLKESTQRMEKWGNMHVHPSEDHVPLLMSAVIFDVSQLISVDATALATLLEIVESYTVMNRRVAFVGLRKRLCSLFQRAGILDHVRQDDLFNSLPAAVAAMTAKSGTAKSTPLKIPAAAPTPRPVTSDAGSGASGDDEEDDDTDCEDRSRKRSSAKHKRASRQSERPTPTKGSSEGSQSHPNVLDFWSWPILRMMNLTWADDHAEDVMAENAGVYGDQAVGAARSSGETLRTGPDHFQPMIAYEDDPDQDAQDH